VKASCLHYSVFFRTHKKKIANQLENRKIAVFQLIEKIRARLKSGAVVLEQFNFEKGRDNGVVILRGNGASRRKP
jgi:hypothetical protein